MNQNNITMSDQQLTITAEIISLPGKREQVKQSLLRLIPPTLAEKGCLNYDLHQDQKNLDRFFFYENWATRQDWLHHNASPHIAAHKKVAEDSILNVVIHELTPIQ